MPRGEHNSKRKGKTYEEIYGVEKAKQLREKKRIPYTEERRINHKIACNTPEAIKHCRESHLGIQYSDEWLASNIASHNTPEYLEKRSILSKEIANRPGIREQMKVTNTEIVHRPEVIKKRAETIANFSEERREQRRKKQAATLAKHIADGTVNLEKVKEQRAATLNKHLLDGTIKPTMFNTKPELKRIAYQISQGYIEGKTLIRQKYLKGIGMVDIFYPLENRIEFIDGDYYHCNPNLKRYSKPCYYNGKRHMFAQQIWNEDKTITERALALNYKVDRLWEYTINKKVKQEVI